MCMVLFIVVSVFCRIGCGVVNIICMNFLYLCLSSWFFVSMIFVCFWKNFVGGLLIFSVFVLIYLMYVVLGVWYIVLGRCFVMSVVSFCCDLLR